MSKKHSKLKNTGIIFELLVRQIASDVLSNKDTKAVAILENFFKRNTELNKELTLYQTLVNDKFNDERKSEKFIDIVLEDRKKLDNKKLKSEKYNLIKTISETFEIENFFKSRVNEYKILASIYKLFESITSGTVLPADVVTSRYALLEHITHKKIEGETIRSKINEEYDKMDKDVRLLAYKLLLNKFNKKYSGLDLKQKNLLREYINNITNSVALKEYVISEIPAIKNTLLKYQKFVDDDIVKIKLQEITKQIDNFMRGDVINDDQILLIMEYYELIKELKVLSKG